MYVVESALQDFPENLFVTSLPPVLIRHTVDTMCFAASHGLFAKQVAQAKLSPPALREGVLLGTRCDSAKALELGMVDAEADEKDLLEAALRKAGPSGSLLRSRLHTYFPR